MVQINTSHFALTFLVIFFLFVSGIILHELVHLVHFQLMGSQIKEVVLLGWNNTSSQSALGWVTATAAFQIHTHTMELIAYAVQMSYMLIGYAFFRRLLFTARPASIAEPFITKDEIMSVTT